MNEGSKPPLPRPGLVQKPGGDARPKAPPPPPPQAFKVGLPKPLDSGSLPAFFRKDILAPVSPIPPAPKIPIAPAASEPVEERPQTPRPGTLIQPKRPERKDVTGILRRSGKNPALAQSGSKPAVEAQAKPPFAEPLPPDRLPVKAHSSDSPVPFDDLPEVVSVIPDSELSPLGSSLEAAGHEEEVRLSMEVDLADLERSSIPPSPIAGNLDFEKHSEEAFRIAHVLLPRGKAGMQFSFEGNKIMLGDIEVGGFSPEGKDGLESIQIWLTKIGIDMNDPEAFPYTSILWGFKAYSKQFLEQAVRNSEDSAISANEKGVWLHFYKTRDGRASHTFPMKRPEEKENK